MFFDLTRTLTLAFWQTLWEVFQTLCDYNFARDLAIHNRFGDLDLVSRSQICQNHKLQNCFLKVRFLSTVL